MGLVHQLTYARLAGEQNHPGFRAFPANQNTGFYAVTAGHADVGEHNIRAKGMQRIQSSVTAVSGAGRKAVEIQDAYQGIGDKLFVVDDQNAL